MNIYDLFAFFNANRGHVPRRIPPSQDIAWPGGRKGMGPTASWEIVGSSQGRWNGRMSVKPDSVGKFLLGTKNWSKRTHVTPGGGLEYIFSFKILTWGRFFSIWNSYFQNLDWNLRSRMIRCFFFGHLESRQIRWKRMCLSCVLWDVFKNSLT